MVKTVILIVVIILVESSITHDLLLGLGNIFPSNAADKLRIVPIVVYVHVHILKFGFAVSKVFNAAFRKNAFLACFSVVSELFVRALLEHGFSLCVKQIPMRLKVEVDASHSVVWKMPPPNTRHVIILLWKIFIWISYRTDPVQIAAAEEIAENDIRAGPIPTLSMRPTIFMIYSTIS